MIYFLSFLTIILSTLLTYIGRKYKYQAKIIYALKWTVYVHHKHHVYLTDEQIGELVKHYCVNRK